MKKHTREFWENFNTPLKDARDVPPIPICETQEEQDLVHRKLVECGAIPKSELKDGAWYYGDYRNANYAMWDKRMQKFSTYRFKFVWIPDSVFHYEDDNGHALFVPLRETNESEVFEHILR